ncbi:MAG: hypothetical protein J2P46_04710 [Zavarzinella sp.]|nr:hypothetical protein [Zavarzinella sp.]
MTEVCQQFAATPARKAILTGFLNLRAESRARGIKGFQWLAGSFLEQIELLEERDPGDIDVVTFVREPNTPPAIRAALTGPPDLIDHHQVKATYSVDHYWVPLSSNPEAIVDVSRYWYGLFSHRRDRTWKGMLIVDLDSPADDAGATGVLGGSP